MPPLNIALYLICSERISLIVYFSTKIPVISTTVKKIVGKVFIEGKQFPAYAQHLIS